MQDIKAFLRIYIDINAWQIKANLFCLSEFGVMHANVLKKVNLNAIFY